MSKDNRDQRDLKREKEFRRTNWRDHKMRNDRRDTWERRHRDFREDNHDTE